MVTAIFQMECCPLPFVNNCQYILICSNDLEAYTKTCFWNANRGPIVIQDGWSWDVRAKWSAVKFVSPLLTSPPTHFRPIQQLIFIPFAAGSQTFSNEITLSIVPNLTPCFPSFRLCLSFLIQPLSSSQVHQPVCLDVWSTFDI